MKHRKTMRAIWLLVLAVFVILPINQRGEVIDASGKHLLDAAHPMWQGKAPVILWPE